jgi:hypothetical protein
MLSAGSGPHDICTNAIVNLSGKQFAPVGRRGKPRIYEIGFLGYQKLVVAPV